MAGKSRRSKLVLSDEDRAELEQLSRSRTLPHREAQRAAIILGYYGGESIASNRQYWETSRDDAPERFEMGGKSSGGGSDAGVERQLPPPQGTSNRRRCQSLGCTCGVLQT